ncbi:MAG: NDP-sugar synthase [Clostridium sp.]|jgi:mannose-1-phosphate guanylyltransferase|uniref:NDP-sugar synthase n=1 Tax=Clostridium sp. TaxID=1506 RepID=UPI0025BB0275|nr:NDP-sugar synthase [Clostridium sp.]MCH3963180.1 NDP-sugar synthase [Clostridium sp.]MCI1716357.1 NDP-sugar synthase [Clostridium sp.]MCI1800697.1 NDP-sugar synthase [Clostridium sp.]MCI1814648.1 NDP-sugar synthase [Clostridium sp.]MCI1871558.1 NDP-sugar synthase [Clostridium sp.]
MKALLLAGGRGTRLRPLTDSIPKPMVPIMGKPLLEKTILDLKKSGVDEVIISTCYKSDYIKNRIANGEKLGIKVDYISEDLPLGTGGAIKNSERFLDDTFIVLNSDIVSNMPYEKFIKYHREKNAQISIAMTEVEDPSQYGVIEFDNNSCIKAFKEKPKKGETDSKWINAGIYIFEPEVLNEIPKNEIVSIEKDTYPLLLNKGYKMAAYKYSDYWLDIGTLKKYLQAHIDIFSSHYNNILGKKPDFKINNLIIKGKNIAIDSDTNIIGPVFIGDNVTICGNCNIGPYTVIGNNSLISSSCTIYKSILWNNVNVDKNVTLRNTVITSNFKVKAHCSIENKACVTNDYNTDLLAI